MSCRHNATYPHTHTLTSLHPKCHIHPLTHGTPPKYTTRCCVLRPFLMYYCIWLWLNNTIKIFLCIYFRSDGKKLKIKAEWYWKHKLNTSSADNGQSFLLFFMGRQKKNSYGQRLKRIFFIVPLICSMTVKLLFSWLLYHFLGGAVNTLLGCLSWHLALLPEWLSRFVCTNSWTNNPLLLSSVPSARPE